MRKSYTYLSLTYLTYIFLLSFVSLFLEDKYSLPRKILSFMVSMSSVALFVIVYREYYKSDRIHIYAVYLYLLTIVSHIIFICIFILDILNIAYPLFLDRYRFSSYTESVHDRLYDLPIFTLLTGLYISPFMVLFRIITDICYVFIETYEIAKEKTREKMGEIIEIHKEYSK